VLKGKILRRCDRCGKFHAAYVVDDPAVVRQVKGENSGEAKVILCQTCWKKLFGRKIEKPRIDTDEHR
jgi:hypothetical protein